MKRKKSGFPLAVLLILTVAVAGVYLANHSQTDAADAEHTVAVLDGSSAGIFTGEPSDTPCGEAESVRMAELKDTCLLELVNLTYPVPGDTAEDFVVPAYRVVPLATADIMLRPEALDAVKALFAGAREAGFDSLYVSSGYRDANKQKQLYDAAADKSYVQPPGYSEHQLGLAVDIMANGVAQADMAAAPEGQWLARNAWRYGFILRYPADKADITGIAYEPWHFRYVGQPHARYCYENNLCFEEYIRFLRDGGSYSLTLEGVGYSVFYATPRNGIITISANGNYEVSDDNTGGYLVTTWG